MNFEAHKKRMFPFVWPWRGANNEKVTLVELIKLKRFSIIYLVIIWSIYGALGFATTREWECESTWQMSLYCEYALWVKNLIDQPWIFIRNLFTTSFLHNGHDHILFVTILGFLVIVQSFEAVAGWKKTAITFFSAYFTVAPFWASFYTVGVEFYPDSEFMQFAFARNWMGGSLGMFQVYGAMVGISRKPLVMLIIPIVFEAINLSILGIDPHISLMHGTCVILGFLIAKRFFKESQQL